MGAWRMNFWCGYMDRAHLDLFRAVQFSNFPEKMLRWNEILEKAFGWIAAPNFAETLGKWSLRANREVGLYRMKKGNSWKKIWKWDFFVFLGETGGKPRKERRRWIPSGARRRQHDPVHTSNKKQAGRGERREGAKKTSRPYRNADPLALGFPF